MKITKILGMLLKYERDFIVANTLRDREKYEHYLLRNGKHGAIALSNSKAESILEHNLSELIKIAEEDETIIRTRTVYKRNALYLLNKLLYENTKMTTYRYSGTGTYSI